MFAFASASALRRSKTLLTSSVSLSTTRGVDGGGLDATAGVETTSDTTDCATTGSDTTGGGGGGGGGGEGLGGGVSIAAADRMTRSALSGGCGTAASATVLLLLLSIPSPLHIFHAFCIKIVAPTVMATTTGVDNPCILATTAETNAELPVPAHTTSVARYIAIRDVTNANAAPTADAPVPTAPTIKAATPESIPIIPDTTSCDGARILFNKIHAHSAVSNAPSVTNSKVLIAFTLTISHPLCTGAKYGNAIDKSLFAINDANTVANAMATIDLYGSGTF